MPREQPCPVCGGIHPPGECEKQPEKEQPQVPKPEEKVLSPEEQKERNQLQQKLEDRLSEGAIYRAEEIINFAKEKNITLDFSKREITSACQKGLEKMLSEGQIEGPSYSAEKVINFAEKKNITLDFSKREITSACQKGLEKKLSRGYIDPAEKIINFAKEKNIALDITSACQKGLEKTLSEGYIDAAEEIINFAKERNITLDFSKQKITPACQKGLEKRLSEGQIEGLSYSAEKVINFAEKKNITLDFSKREITSACQKGLEKMLSEGWINPAEEVINFAEKKNITLDFSKREITSACQKGLEKWLSEGWIDDAEEIVNFAIDPAEEIINFAKEKNIALDIASACQKGLEKWLSEGRMDDAEKIINFAKEKNIALDITSACQKGLEESLSKRRIDDAEKIINFAEKKNIDLDITSACQKGLEKLLLNNYLETALEIQNRFLHLPPEKAFELYSSHLKRIFDELPASLSNLIEQSKKSIDLLFSLFAFRENPEQLTKTIKENPFLSRALQENHRFGPKLIVKYPQFDEVSKEKISFLYQAKEEIVKKYPDLDPQSLEFRQMMQEKLADFAQNKEIVEEIKKTGIEIDKFLNYQETAYFRLTSGEELIPFSERIQAPIIRLAETISSYGYQIKDVLREYRQDLLEFEILPKSAEELQSKISQMEKELIKAQQEGNEKKAQGISRGLEGMKQKLSQIKPQSLWNRIIDEITKFSILKQSLEKSQQSLIDKEKRYFELSSQKGVSGKDLLQAKGDLAQAKELFKKELFVLEKRVLEFKNGLTSLLAPLGKDRAISLVQEINERTAEQFTHFDSDRTTLANLFSERADKEKEKLEDREMSIFVWTRNPDIDLYQGNYSPCCICIESAHMGAQSPIADYATDLGIQIVNVFDETKNEPVVAAWTWLGIDKDGKTALVIDNIEANTLYSSNFPTELSKELFAYLINYAKTINADYLVLGKANNDLPTASELSKLPEAKATYTKLGEYNLRSHGYYLEAEGHRVKLLWEKGKKERKEKSEKEIKKPLELKEITVKEVNEDVFDQIIALEKEVYGEELARGWQMIEDFKKNNGKLYSTTLFGIKGEKTKPELLAYLIAYEDKTDEGEPCVYLDDIAVAPDCRGQGLGWQLLQETISRLKQQAKKQGKPILFDMHLRENSQRLFESHQNELKQMGVDLIESVLVPDYYDEGEDALYCLYKVKEG